MNKHILFAIAAAVCASGLAKPAVSPADTAAMHIGIHEITVMGEHYEAVKSAPASLISVLDNSVCTAVGADCLSQSLDYSPGVRVETGCQNCGFTELRINGLSGHYSQILLDSHPIFPSLLSIYGLELLSTSQLKRMEVTRGGSVIGSPAAIGGTVNLVSNEATSNYLNVGHTLYARKGWNSFENVTGINASIVNKEENAGAFVYGQFRHRGNWDANGDGYSEITRLDNHSIGINSHLNTKNLKLKLQLHSIKSDSRGGNNLNLPPFEANIAEMVGYNVNGGCLSIDTRFNRHSIDAYASIDHVSRDSYYGGMGNGSDEERQDALLAYGKTLNVTFIAGARDRIAFNGSLPIPALLTVGADYRNDYLKDNALGYNTVNRQRVKTGGLYGESKWNLSNCSLSASLRADKHNLIHRLMLTPAATLRWNASRKASLRLGYSSGFRAPEVYDEDLHVSSVGGEKAKTVLEKDLREERSHSVNISCDSYFSIGDWHLNLTASSFFTRICHSFDQRYLDSTDDNGFTLLERYNSFGSKIYGVSGEVNGMWGNKAHFNLGATLQHGRMDEDRSWSEDAEPSDKLFRSPDAYGYCSLCYHVTSRFEVCLSGTFTGKMWMQHCASSGVDEDVALRTPSFVNVNFKAEYEIPLSHAVGISVNAGVKNIFNSYQCDFDKGPERDSNYIYGPAIPFSPFMGIVLSLR